MTNMVITKNSKAMKYLNQYFQISIGVILLAIAFYFFMNPAKLVCGGMYGVETLIETPIKEGLHWDWYQPSYFLYTVGIITLILGLIFLGKDFFIKTVYATILSPTVELLLEKTCDPNYFMNNLADSSSMMIVAVVASIALGGVGIGLTVKNNGCTGGMDVIQRIMSKYMKVPLSITMYLTDMVIVAFAGFTFIPSFKFSIDRVIFGLVVVYGMAYLIDMFAMNGHSRRTVYTVTTIPHEVKELIYRNADRGVTFANVTGAYSGDNKTMVICTMEKNEAYRIVPLIKELDPTAFTFVTSCKEVVGEFDKRGII